MKYRFLTLLLLLFSLNLSAQEAPAQPTAETDSVSTEMQSVIDTFIAMRDAVAAGNKDAIIRAAENLEDADITDFHKLSCKDDTICSPDGHMIFDLAYADSLVTGRPHDPLEAGTARGQSPDGSLRTKTCFVKAGKSTRYTFPSSGHQELAVVAEVGGLVTMRIHVTNSAGLDQRYDDTTKVRQGMPQRKRSFDLPKNKRNNVELEIINCGSKDCSFVVISN